MAAGGSGAMSGPISKDDAKRLLVSAPMEVVERAPSPFVEGVKDVTFGSIAGIASKFLEHPFDLCKVRLQAQVLEGSARFKGPLDCLAQTWRKEGVRGLYRGLPAPIVGAMAENATLFMAYGQLQRLLNWMSGRAPTHILTLPELVVSAAGAGAITSFVLTPIELVKCKMQVQMLTAVPQANSSATTIPQIPKNLPGPLTLLASIVRTHGLRGLWLGQTGTLIRETGGSAAWFGSKEAFSRYLLRRREKARALEVAESGIDARSLVPLTKRDLTALESAGAGAFAGIAYNAVLFPADTVKSAMQTEEEMKSASGSATKVGSGSAKRTFFGIGKEMYAKGGIKGLYAGCGITIARSIPSSALIFLIYDSLAKRFA